MKKLIVLMFFFVTMLNCIVAQGFQFVYGTNEIAPGVILSADSLGYLIDYTLPKFKEEIVKTDCGSFSIIRFDGDGGFIEMSSIGRPALPVKNVNLQIPVGVNNVEYHVIQEVPTDLLELSDSYTYLQLQYPYYPAQEVFEDSTIVYSVNEDLYRADVWYGCNATNNVAVSEIYHYLGCAGISVNLLPVEYNPNKGIVRVPKRIRVKVDVPLGALNEEVLLKSNPVTFFDSWWSFCVPITFGRKSRLLIVTLPEFEEAMNEYRNYKSAVGYDVELIADESFCKSSILRDTLFDRYHSTKRPDFVLIVGDPTYIPYSSGVRDKYLNPPTDIYYACLEKTDISKEPMSPDVCVGRWPVSDESEIHNIALKTIRFEQEIIHYNCSVSLFSGIGSGKNIVFRNIKAVADDLKNRMKNVYLYDGRSFNEDTQAARSAMISTLKDNAWIFEYRGHGWYDRFSIPYDFTVWYCPASTICPITFSLSCLTNAMYMYDGKLQPSLGMRWLRNSHEKGGVTFLGATTESDRFENNYMNKKIFGRLARIDMNDRCVGNFIYNGMMDYYSSCKVVSRRHQVEKYVLMGDPSMFMSGINFNVNTDKMNVIKTARSYYEGCVQNKMSFQSQAQQLYGSVEEEELPLSVQHETIDVAPTITDDLVWVCFSGNANADVKILSLGGSILYTQENCVSGTSLSMSSLSDGVYIVAIQTSDGQSGNYKVIVKH